MRTVEDDDCRKDVVSRPATWERYRPAADRIVREAAAILDIALPESVAWVFWLKALSLGQTVIALVMVVAVLAKKPLRSAEIAELRADRLGDDEWTPNADGRDGERAFLCARMIEAELRLQGRPFMLYQPMDLLDAVDDALAGTDGDATKAMLALAKTLSATGFRRALATLPEDVELTHLAQEMPNFAAVVRFYAGQAALARLAGRTVAMFPPVLLLGDPGVGKTVFAERLAATLRSVCRRIPMSSASAGWILTGLDRGWGTAKPGMVYTTLASAPMANVVILVDEVDKAAQDRRYDPMGGMYQLLESETACKFVDEYAGFAVNASAIVWIATANDRNGIPDAILSRFIAFEIDAPDGDLARQIITRMFESVTNGVTFAPLDDAIVDALLGFSPREALARLKSGVGLAAQRACSAGMTVPALLLEDLELPPAPRPGIGFV